MASAQLNTPSKPGDACWTSLTDGPLWQMNQVWSSGDAIRSTVTFRSDGVQVYTYNNQTYDNGRWQLTGDKLHIDTNNHFADFEGELSHNVAFGLAQNTRNETGWWTLWRDCPAG